MNWFSSPPPVPSFDAAVTEAKARLHASVNAEQAGFTMQVLSLSAPPRECAENTNPLDYDASARGEYTQRHRCLWPLLLRGLQSETLNPVDRRSWMRLWGREGEDLYRCFVDGDPFIRADMIALARHHGGWRGKIVADELAIWETSIPAPLFCSITGDSMESDLWGIEGIP